MAFSPPHMPKSCLSGWTYYSPAWKSFMFVKCPLIDTGSVFLKLPHCLHTKIFSLLVIFSSMFPYFISCVLYGDMFVGYISSFACSVFSHPGIPRLAFLFSYWLKRFEATLPMTWYHPYLHLSKLHTEHSHLFLFHHTSFYH